ncbi:hypothetical protein KO493_13015 [Tamlana agarivorans]|uniref:Uncharacterized protein n=1 Tax=Pseudotamlana agarivorans TaxID=481183 RepID=A0ACC5UBC6_9FLAO|nr:hypothetical protein [Tamlana agarivorans]MBU2951621.1 hypothetical protein [Tamlana agarivorans]
MKKALIIGPDFMGYTEKIAENLSLNQNIQVTHINIPRFKYQNTGQRLQNVFLKNISKDLKFNFREDFIINKLGDSKFDTILVLRPDQLSVSTIKYLKAKTSILKTYLYDGINRYPKQLKPLKYFNEVYSFEPNDCKKYGFISITNFIYDTTEYSEALNHDKYCLFNITSYDRKRLPVLLKIASILKSRNKSYKIIVKTAKKINTNLVEIIKKPMPFDDVKKLLNTSICMLDLGLIKKHRGLTFRVFEAMGLHKKIITNNSEIANYDFYDPQNILIIDEKNLEIPESFFQSPYNPIPKHIYNKYTLDFWVQSVFKELF